MSLREAKRDSTCLRFAKPGRGGPEGGPGKRASRHLRGVAGHPGAEDGDW
jgi:hypothetical protein